MSLDWRILSEHCDASQAICQQFSAIPGSPFKSLIFEINPCKIHHILIDSYIIKRSLHEKV